MDSSGILELLPRFELGTSSLPTHNRLIFLVIVYSVLSSFSPCRPRHPAIFLPLLAIPCQQLATLPNPCPCQFCVSFSRERHRLTSSLQITIPAGKRADWRPTQSHVRPPPPPYDRRQHPGKGPAPPAPYGPPGWPQKGGFHPFPQRQHRKG